jgi:hypothetical protein
VTKRDLDELRVGAGTDASDSGEAEALARTVRGSRQWRTIVLRAAAPVLAWFALGVVLFGTQRDTDYDLQLIVSGAVQAGSCCRCAHSCTRICVASKGQG